MIWKSGGGPPFRIFWGAICLVFSKSASQVGPDSVPMSIRQPFAQLKKSIGKYNFFLLF